MKKKDLTFNELTEKHRHRRNVTSYHFLGYSNFHQQTNFIKRQLSSTDNFLQLTIFINRQLSSIDNLHPHSPESHQSSLQKASSLTRVTPVKSLEGILTHQSLVYRRHLHSPGSHQSSLLKVSSFTRVTSVKSLEGIFTHQSHISQVSRRHPYSPESTQSSL